jgi:hypothetical protein
MHPEHPMNAMPRFFSGAIPKNEAKNRSPTMMSPARKRSHSERNSAVSPVSFPGYGPNASSRIAPKTLKTTATPFIDAVRPLDADGPLVSLICSTYGLSLDQPNFFEQDFLPTVLGLGGLRDRGYAVPVALEGNLRQDIALDRMPGVPLT